MYDALVGLQDSVSVLKGIGPKSVRLLAKLDVHTIGDLLTMFPRRFEDRTQTSSLSACLDGEAAYVTGIADAFTERQIRKGLTLSKLTFRDEAGAEGEAVWFVPKGKLSRIQGMRISLYGKVKRGYGKISFQNPDIALLPSEQQDAAPNLGLVPVYGLTEGLAQANLREWVEAALTTYAPTLSDELPGTLRAKYGLPHRMTAIKDMHIPANAKHHEMARRRFAYEELLILHGVLQSRKFLMADKTAPSLSLQTELQNAFVDALPFELTSSQASVIADVLTGLQSTSAMLRLIQGDVGCGKTVVAAVGLLAAVSNGFQAAFLAPTDLLARQQVTVIRG
jgi:ATP-dependent DNA helicase RecG